MNMHGETQKSPMHDKPNIPVPPKQRKKLKTAPARTPADQRLGTAPGDSGAENLKNKSKATNKNMKNKTQTLACPQASSTRASGPLRKKHRMSSAALAGLVLALAPAAQAAIIIDNVEDEGDYTFIHTTGGGTNAYNAVAANPTPYNGLSAVAGTNVVYVYNNMPGEQTGTVTHTLGFGSDNTIQAGTYVYTMSVGQPATTRPGFQQWDMRLQTTSGGTELANVVNTIAYVPPTYVHNVTATAAWVSTTKTYTINPGDSLIGEEFTWAADWSNRASGNTTNDDIWGVFDAVSIEFTAIPEPSSFALTALGLLGLVGRRRR